MYKEHLTSAAASNKADTASDGGKLFPLGTAPIAWIIVESIIARGLVKMFGVCKKTSERLHESSVIA
jgi:hypothetical protein